MRIQPPTFIARAVRVLTLGLLACCAALGVPMKAQGPARLDTALLLDRPAAERPTLMVLGVMHLDNPGRDVVNTKMDDVLAPERQRQLALLVERLRAFRPTRIAVEWAHSDQAKLDHCYAEYRAGRYALGRGEAEQIGFRLAAALDLPQLDAIDWNEMPPGQVSDFDYMAFAETHGLQARIDAIRKSNVRPEEPARRDLVELLREANAPEALAMSNRRYFDYALIGDETHFPGANWVGNWYARNLKIFDHLVRLPARPKERLLVIYGVGHAFLLRQFAEQSGAFTLEDPRAWLTLGDTQESRTLSRSKTKH